jgi:CRP-like cAMP-binding protein
MLAGQAPRQRSDRSPATRGALIGLDLKIATQSSLVGHDCPPGLKPAATGARCGGHSLEPVFAGQSRHADGDRSYANDRIGSHCARQPAAVGTNLIASAAGIAGLHDVSQVIDTTCPSSLRSKAQPFAGGAMRAEFAFSKFAGRLANLVELSSDDLDLLAGLPSSIDQHGSREHILQRGETSTQCHLLLQGYLCWLDPESRDGKIISIHVPGDVPDLHTIHDDRLDYNLVSIGPAIVASVPHHVLRDLCGRSPSVARALLLMILADVAGSRNWIVNLSSRDALQRVAHLLCEIAARLRAVGLARDLRIPSPFTQSDLAAACSISAIHANRTMQELHRSNLLQWHARTITITDWNGLVRLAGFNPAYLRLPAQETVETAEPTVMHASDSTSFEVRLR